MWWKKNNSQRGYIWVVSTENESKQSYTFSFHGTLLYPIRKIFPWICGRLDQRNHSFSHENFSNQMMEKQVRRKYTHFSFTCLVRGKQVALKRARKRKKKKEEEEKQGHKKKKKNTTWLSCVWLESIMVESKSNRLSFKMLLKIDSKVLFNCWIKISSPLLEFFMLASCLTLSNWPMVKASRFAHASIYGRCLPCLCSRSRALS